MNFCPCIGLLRLRIEEIHRFCSRHFIGFVKRRRSPICRTLGLLKCSCLLCIAAFSKSTRLKEGLCLIMARCGARTLAIALALAVAAWSFEGLRSFCGNMGLTTRQPATACNGWRLDKMEVGPGGIGQLVVAEGFFIGEKDMYKVLNKQGRRYRLRPSAQDRKDGKSVPGIFQLGPFKIHLEQCFRGSGGDVDLQRPEGYSGNGGMAGWAEELPVKKLGYGRWIGQAWQEPDTSQAFSELAQVSQVQTFNPSACGWKSFDWPALLGCPTALASLYVWLVLYHACQTCVENYWYVAPLQ